jgi:GntR family transcriptional repressor for pyruvate dehydrogenase complex
MEEQGVSRTVVREAISRLAGRQVWWRPAMASAPSFSTRRARVAFRIDPATIVTLRDVLAILELRISLEVESAGLAAQRRSVEQLADMRAALDALNESAAHASDAVGLRTLPVPHGNRTVHGQPLLHRHHESPGYQHHPAYSI